MIYSAGQMHGSYKVSDKKFPDISLTHSNFSLTFIFSRCYFISFPSSLLDSIWFLIVALYFYISTEDTYFQQIREKIIIIIYTTPFVDNLNLTKTDSGSLWNAE